MWPNPMIPISVSVEREIGIAKRNWQKNRAYKPKNQVLTFKLHFRPTTAWKGSLCCAFYGWPPYFEICSIFSPSMSKCNSKVQPKYLPYLFKSPQKVTARRSVINTKHRDSPLAVSTGALDIRRKRVDVVFTRVSYKHCKSHAEFYTKKYQWEECINPRGSPFWSEFFGDFCVCQVRARLGERQ